MAARDWQSEAAVVVDALLAHGQARWPTVGRFRVLLDSLEQDLVTVEGFGLFEVEDYPAYEGRNPRTGERLRVEARRGVLFRSADELRDRVAGMTLRTADDELDD
jgi:integration host factor subunit beta